MSDEYLTKKLIKEVTNAATTNVYKIVVERLAARGITYDVDQVRAKFKSCLQIVNRAIKTVKTSTGLARFQDEKGYSRWFEMLIPILTEKIENKAGLNVEPDSETTPVSAPRPPSRSSGEFISSCDIDMLTFCC